MNTLARLARQLSAAYPPGEARALARWTLEDGVGLSQTDILMGKDSELSADDHARLQNIVSRLMAGEPLQYIVGHAPFCGRRFGVRPGVLIPRPETEELVRLIRERLAPTLPHEAQVLDIGTGSGCIALTLALDLPRGVRVTAWDISPEALRIARENAGRLGAEVRFEQQDVLHLEADSSRWNLIVSNPPYVRRLEAREMARNVLDHEPHLALFVPDDDALRFYRAIAHYAQDHLLPGGWLCFEINRYLSEETAQLLASLGYQSVSIHQDLYGHPRFVLCQHP